MLHTMNHTWAFLVSCMSVLIKADSMMALSSYEAIRQELSDLRETQGEMESAKWTDIALHWSWGHFLSPRYRKGCVWVSKVIYSSKGRWVKCSALVKWPLRSSACLRADSFIRPAGCSQHQENKLEEQMEHLWSRHRCFKVLCILASWLKALD